MFAGNARKLMVAGVVVLAVGQGWAQSAAPAAKAADAVVMARPEAVGFDAKKLENLHKVMQATVDAHTLAGGITVVARHGKVVDYQTYGMRDAEAKVAMTKDTIFRVYSMSKPITGVGMMLLYEQGKWLPTDPIAKYLPEFAGVKVYAGTNADGTVKLEAPEHAPTIGELMTHTAGLTYGYFGTTPVDKMYRDAAPLQAKGCDEFVGKLAKLPLLYQPGKEWVYSVSMDVEGCLIERISGERFGEFLRKNLFEPLGMKDTGFVVPAEKIARLTQAYDSDANGQMEVVRNAAAAREAATKDPGFESGGGGLFSTAEDYLKFAEMLSHGGAFGGKRILSPATVKLMTTNHLRDELMTGQWSIGAMRMRPGFGYGYNGAVVTEPGMAQLPEGKGTYLWDGAAGTWFWVDPTNDVVVVGMIQRRLDAYCPPVEWESRAAVYGALVDPAK